MARASLSEGVRGLKATGTALALVPCGCDSTGSPDGGALEAVPAATEGRGYGPRVERVCVQGSGC